MSTKFNISEGWYRWFQRQPQLPAHLPRLVLNKRFHPRFVQRCAVTQQLLPLLQLIDWEQLPTTYTWRPSGERTVPLAAYVGAYLVKLERKQSSFGSLRRFLREHPALIWALGFPLISKAGAIGGFDADASLPSHNHFTKKLSLLPNDALQSLLDSQIVTFKQLLGAEFGRIVSIDTKHILAWVKENNPKTYIKEGRLDKTRQPAGDTDCKLGCKRRRNQQATPRKEGQSATGKASIGEYYWGYASGVIATKVDGIGEFVLAECTQTFDYSDVSYFFPLIEQVEKRLACRPPFFTADAAFDSFYIYDYFHQPDKEGFAAIPLRQMKHDGRSFDENGLPLCEADLPMSLKSKFTNRTSLVQHQRGRYVCPLVHPEITGESCPIAHTKWPEGGCKTTFPTAQGARIRYQLDREGDNYKNVYRHRTAVERIFSQAVALGIERPRLRNQAAIANHNTLTYLLINLRALRRLEHNSAVKVR